MAFHVARLGAIGGPVLAAAILLAGPPSGVPPAAWRALAVLAWMVTWWVLQPVPLAVTALLPLVLFPALGVLDPVESAAPYASPVVFLLLGGFLLARAVERSSLHRRVAEAVLRRIRGSATGALTGIMAATAVLGMWMSVSATALLMMPIALSIVGEVRGPPTRRHTASVLAVPYAAAIAAVATLVATPPIALLASSLESDHGVSVGFARWLLVGGSVALAGLAFAWLVLRHQLRAERASTLDAPDVLREMTAAQMRVALLVLGVIALWLVGPLVGLDEMVVAIVGGVVAFLVPDGRGGRLLDSSDLPHVAWGILILVGGGLSLGVAATTSGLADQVVGVLAGLASLPWLLALLVLAGATTAISEMSSNTATAAALLPLSGPIAASLGIGPVVVATTLALASCAGFAMPVATPANAIAYGTGLVPLSRMIRLGILLDVAMVILAVAGGVLAGAVLEPVA